MSEKEVQSISDFAPLSRKRWICAGAYTFAYLGCPLIVYSHQKLFKRFCDFHKRHLRLQSKGPGQIAALSLLCSIIYTSIACPIYYIGLLKILGITSLFQFAGCITSSAADTYRKYPKIKRIDHKLVVEIDKMFGYTPEQTKKFIRKNYGDEFVDD